MRSERAQDGVRITLASVAASRCWWKRLMAVRTDFAAFGRCRQFDGLAVFEIG